MTIASTAQPRPHLVVGSQLIRHWEPEGAVAAEVVLVHGLAEHSGRYERTGALLAASGLEVTAPDLVGFGATGGRRGHVEDWAQFLDQVEALVGAAEETGRPVVLMGHSMGALIALEYALSERPDPDLLVLSAPALSGGAGWQRAVAPILARLAPKLKIPNRLKGEQLSRDPAVGEEYFADPLVYTSSTARLGAELFAAIDRTRSALSSLSVPTYVLHGGMDSIVPPTSTVKLGALPGVERHLHPTLRHEVLNEPEGPELVAAIADWILARVGSGSLDVDD
ncbi:MAG: lysophospholipase [Acidimicrobiia bacterium]